MPQREDLHQRYRHAADEVISELREHPKVIGIATCGSLVRGDLWEGSDVDLFVVMRKPEADWHALTVRHDDVNVHLQILSEEFLFVKSEGFRGSVISQVLSLAQIVYDPGDTIGKGIEKLASYPRDSQVHDAVKHLIAFLAEYNRARKCMQMQYTEDAFLHLNLAFRELAYVEYARHGVYAQHTIIDELSDVSPNAYNAYIWLIFGGKKTGERIRRSFAFFEGLLDEILYEIGPPLIAALRAYRRPVTEEDIGNIPAVYDRSADLKLLIERMVNLNIIREQGRTVELEGVPLANLSENLFELF